MRTWKQGLTRWITVTAEIPLKLRTNGVTLFYDNVRPVHILYRGALVLKL